MSESIAWIFPFCSPLALGLRGVPWGSCEASTACPAPCPAKGASKGPRRTVRIPLPGSVLWHHTHHGSLDLLLLQCLQHCLLLPGDLLAMNPPCLCPQEGEERETRSDPSTAGAQQPGDGPRCCTALRSAGCSHRQDTMSMGRRGSSEAEAEAELASAQDMAPRLQPSPWQWAWGTGVLGNGQGFGVSISRANGAASL